MRRCVVAGFVACFLAAVPAAARAQVAAAADAAAPSAGESAVSATVQAPGNISRVYFIKVKPGMNAEWMAAAAEHVAWHAEQNDPWVWTAFYVETGKNTGQYGWVTQGHEWSDFDTYDATLGPADGEHAAATTGPYEESYTSIFTQGLPQFSNPPPPGSTFPLVAVTHYTVDMSMQDQFAGAIAKAHEALQEAGWDAHYSWNVQANGGAGVVFTLVFPMDSWADMAAPEPSIDQIFEDALGRYEAQQLMQDFSGAVIGVESWIARILPELSHNPGQ